VKGKYEIGFFCGYVRESKCVTLEMPRIRKSLEEDMEKLYILKNIYV